MKAPVYSIAAQGRPQVSVAAIGRPAVVSVTVPGPQGAQGERGLQGIQGEPGDYGSIRYDEMSGLPPTTIAPNELVPFVVTQPTVIESSLRGPFAGHAFLDADNVLRARAVGDVYVVRPRLQIVTTQASGRVEIGAVIMGNASGIAGFNAARKVDLSEQAGTPETVDVDFLLFPKAGFLATGALLMLRCSVPAQISSETLFIIPQVAGA